MPAISMKSAAVGAAVGAVAAFTTPAHALVYATGEFAYTPRGGVCVETYAGTSVGLATRSSCSTSAGG